MSELVCRVFYYTSLTLFYCTSLSGILVVYLYSKLMGFQTT